MLLSQEVFSCVVANTPLLEAMGSKALICANKNEFNSAILGDDALYFSSSTEVTQVIESVYKNDYLRFIDNNVQKIKEIYEWETIIDQYEKFLFDCLK